MTDKEKLEKLKKLADAMYYAAANLGPTIGSGEHLRKTMEEYHKFIIHEYHKEELINENLEEAADEWDGSLYRSDAIIAGAKWQKEQMIRQLENIVYRRYSPDGGSEQRNKDLIKLIQNWKCPNGV